ncbi:40S ribosomal S12-related protein, putative [Theileria annulata]|uniref:40S ribosomal S12-related protein, putative n=1 Tax=Theileria annulata TaxID=5874 RepID=Q4UAB9_THEAN|nr:40S ribosomal S12-related protein, putative [Theileria annulata]CAI76232.1 40S ribosomal S12-related protein, putative [Theileria annulata]|eukprot:XP_952857.1 40S ribosomal S12-related protein, putative [Theileria annulata]
MENYILEESYISPIAKPKLTGKSLLRSLKLIKRALTVEKLAKQYKLGQSNINQLNKSNLQSTTDDKSNLQSTEVVNSSLNELNDMNLDIHLTRLVKRGVLDVTKSLRKGIIGIVLIASDVHPIDVVSHLPILCEELSISYAYVTNKRILSDICQSKRPTCAVLIVKPVKDLPNKIKKLSENNKLDYTKLYHKVDQNIKKCHPYL